MRFVYEPPSKRLSFRTWVQTRRAKQHAEVRDVRPEVDMMVEGKPLGMQRDDLEDLSAAVADDAGRVVKQALLNRAAKQPQYKLPRMANLSLVLCDDARIRALNLQYRGKDAPTDVLSFDMNDDFDFKVHLPVKLLGDMFISLDTAQRQAAERGYSLRDELRVLLVHGVLHLCGYDHERSQQEHEEMAHEEQLLMQQLGWQGQGLISAVTSSGGPHGDAGGAGSSSSGGGSGSGSGSGCATGAGQPEKKQARAGDDAPARHAAQAASALAAALAAAPPVGSAVQGCAGVRKWPAGSAGGGELGVLGNVFGSSGSSSNTSGQASARLFSSSSSSHQPGPGHQPGRSTAAAATTASAKTHRRHAGDKARIKLVALDMDGTLLNSKSQISPSSAEVIREACAKGVRVVLATGKARPAALRACETAGLAGEGLAVWDRGPGIFLQGLAVHGHDGTQLSDAQLPPAVVAAAFKYVEDSGHRVSLCAFLGDECATLRMSDDLHALHSVYYEPLAQVLPSLDALLSGPPVRKLLFMTTPQVVEATLKPHWSAALADASAGADVLQAVPNMLEIVPRGVDKWVGAQVLLQHLRLPRESFMAVGDGGNDKEIVANAGVGVAMGNAVPSVKKVASHVVASNDDDGITEAFTKFVL